MRTLISLLLISLATSCGGETKPSRPAGGDPAKAVPAPPSIDQARTIIEGSPEFSEYQFTNAGYSLPMMKSAMNEPALAAAKDLSAAKWIGFDGDGRVVLTGKASSDKRFLVRPNGFLDIVPLAKKEMLEVTDVTRGADGAPLVGFRWRWLPNETGRAFRSGPVHERFATEQRARATLMHDGNDWTVLRIESW